MVRNLLCLLLGVNLFTFSVFASVDVPLRTDDVADHMSPETPVVDRIDGFPIVEDEGEFRVVFEMNDAGEMVSISLDEYLESKGRNFLQSVANYFNFKKTFQTVTSYITEEMEKRFDLFIIVNVDYRKLTYTDQQIPSQHMRILRKSKKRQKVFTRDSSGQISGFNSDVLGMGTEANPASPAFDCLQEQEKRFSGSSRGLMEANGLFKVSSGAGRSFKNTPWYSHDAYLDTPTGVFRFNDRRNSEAYRGRSYNKNKTATFRSMYFPVYFDLNYPIGYTQKAPLGKESALAMHGTNTGSYGRLGSQASHGCVRTHKQVSWCVKSQFHELDNKWTQSWQLNSSNSHHGGPLFASQVSDKTPFLDSRFRLKSEMYDETTGNLFVKPGTSALFIIFYGYDENLETGEIVEI